MEKKLKLGDVVEIKVGGNVINAYVSSVTDTLCLPIYMKEVHKSYNLRFGSKPLDYFKYREVGDRNGFESIEVIGNLFDKDNTKFVLQITSAERTYENREWFDSCLEKISNGHTDKVFNEFMELPKSDTMPTALANLLLYLIDADEKTIWDNGEYFLTAGKDIIVLYKYVN